MNGGFQGAFLETKEWAQREQLRCLALPEVDSTNLLAKNELSKNQPSAYDLIIANHQTAGRGQGDHAWFDQPGQALLSSWILKSKTAPQPVFTSLVGQAMLKSVAQVWPQVAWSLKPPNDLLVFDAQVNANKKIAGILVEVVSAGTDHTIIIGLGFNVSGAPSGLTPFAATHLTQALALRSDTLTTRDWTLFLSSWYRSIRCLPTL